MSVSSLNKKRKCEDTISISIFSTPSIMARVFDMLPLISVICMLHVFPGLKKHFSTIRMMQDRFWLQYHGLNPIIPQLLQDETKDFAFTGSIVLAILADAPWSNTIGNIDIVAAEPWTFRNRLSAKGIIVVNQPGFGYNSFNNTVTKIYHSDDKQIQVIEIHDTYDAYVREFDFSMCANYYIPGGTEGTCGTLVVTDISAILKKSCTLAIDQKYVPFVAEHSNTKFAIFFYTGLIDSRLQKYRKRGYCINIEYDKAIVKQIPKQQYVDMWLEASRKLK
jgi:hypothetical protein